MCRLCQKNKKAMKSFDFTAFFGAMEGTRTPGLLIRSQSLYPAELPSHVGMKADLHSIFSGRGRRNRTLNQWFWRPLLYQLSYTPTKISGFLSSQGASPQVLSAFAGLTAVFGMGTGGSPQLSPLNYQVIQDSYPDNCIKMFFLNGSPTWRPLPFGRILCLSQVLGLLVPVRSVHRCTSTPGLSTTSSLWDLTYFRNEKPHL